MTPAPNLLGVAICLRHEGWDIRLHITVNINTAVKVRCQYLADYEKVYTFIANKPWGDGFPQLPYNKWLNILPDILPTTHMSTIYTDKWKKYDQLKIGSGWKYVFLKQTF